MKKQYKHKQTEEIVKKDRVNIGYYYTEKGCSIPKRFIENTNDWEPVVEEVTGWFVNSEFPNWIKYKGSDKCYGINIYGSWFCQDNESTSNPSNTPATQATTLQMLSEYATKLGYKEGVNIESLVENKISTIAPHDFELRYNALWLGVCCIMKNGIWATIVKQSSFTTEQLVELKELINKNITSSET